jgi:hypothetical protein
MEGADLAKVEAESKDIIQKLKELNGNYNWQPNGDKPCLMFKIEVENRVASKGVAVVNFPIEKVLAFFDLPDPTPRINEMCVKYQILYKDPKDAFKVIYMEMKATWPVSNRDFVLVSARSTEGDVVFMGTKSCSYPHPEVNGVVRADLHVGGYIIEKIDANSTRVTYISDSDAKGNIPAMIKNTVSAKQGGVASKVEAAIQKAGI